MRKYFFSLLLILIAFFTFNISCYAVEDSSRFFLYGFGDDYDSDDYLTLHNTRTCYVMMKNIPISEADNIRLTVMDESIAEVRFIARGSNSNSVITATIAGKKIGTTDIIASLTYNGVNYTSKITTTVHESNYRISLRRADNSTLESSIINKGENLKLKAILIQGMSSIIGDVSSNGVTWTSNNNNILKVNSEGLVTAVGAGKTSIIAKYKTNEGVMISSSYEIEVKDNTTENAKIRFFYDDPGPSMVLDFEEKYSVGLENIPKSEVRNIQFKTDNEKIAKVTNIQYDSNSGMAIAKVKYLSAGKTKLIATLNYGGRTYSASYDIGVKVAKIKFYYDDPGPAMILGYNDKYSVALENIPVFLKNDIKFKIENEKIAKIKNIQYDSKTADAVVTVEYLSAGNTNLIATINYGGKTYSATYHIEVKNKKIDNSDGNISDGNISDGTNSDSTNSNDNDSDNTNDSNLKDGDSEADNSSKNDNLDSNDTEVGNIKVDKTNTNNSKDSHSNTGLLVLFSVLVGGLILVTIIVIVIRKKKLSNN